MGVLGTWADQFCWWRRRPGDKLEMPERPHHLRLARFLLGDRLGLPPVHDGFG